MKMFTVCRLAEGEPIITLSLFETTDQLFHENVWFPGFWCFPVQPQALHSLSVSLCCGFLAKTGNVNTHEHRENLKCRLKQRSSHKPHGEMFGCGVTEMIFDKEDVGKPGLPKREARRCFLVTDGFVEDRKVPIGSEIVNNPDTIQLYDANFISLICYPFGIFNLIVMRKL